MIEHDAKPRTKTGSALQILRLIHLTTAQSIRAKHRHPATGLILAMVQTLIMLAIFMFIMSMLRGSGGLTVTSPINGGDRVIFLMTGIFLFMTHNQAVSATASAPGVHSPLTNHRPINSTILLIGAALGSLYTQVLSMLVLLTVYHCTFKPLVIDDMIGTFGFLLLAWFSGVAIGVFANAREPWAPRVISIARLVYRRANMVASGKMFLVNSLPGDKRAYFDWNPLFHTIDQARGEAFLNYAPRYTSLEYPLYLSLVFLTIGLIGEFYTRQNISLSWSATR